MLEDPVFGGRLVDFLLDLEADPKPDGRTILADTGFRRIELTKIADLCVGYDLEYRSGVIFPSIASISPREIYVWEIAQRERFDSKVFARTARGVIISR